MIFLIAIIVALLPTFAIPSPWQASNWSACNSLLITLSLVDSSAVRHPLCRLFRTASLCRGPRCAASPPHLVGANKCEDYKY
ncbi:hypothetical protein HD554DRAFT_2104257 [Boletus coccyginus]|nr:hypothetical protein HD554DRAFT_2104257 [Boletus coccyginus]